MNFNPDGELQKLRLEKIVDIILPLLDMNELLMMKKIVQRKLLCWIQSQISVFMSKNKSYKVVSVFIMQYGLSVISCGLLDMDVGMLSKLSL